jgi:hypothetical protein
MFCPKCATQNLEGASFCRSCGANISLIPQALAGQVPPQNQEGSERHRRRRGKGEVTLDQSFKNIFMGIAFLIVAIALSRTIGQGWWFWMLLPAFSMMGTGIAQYIRIKEREKRFPNIPAQNTFPARGTAADLSAAPRTGQLMPPVPSVTEGTTRHLGADAPGRRVESDQ